ncbi:hypothetical protein [Halodesulfovibrio aestuarii]|uniref:Uncharacterized protein n=1 Tax=Halodesulfovibrio aestuarii TaxID=126333 RepID=A0A8G2CBC5_9BACT|nr:hypothetical protein [Halodesulfovibrio aestuarii]SHJ50347.1 hypothetical protein SAMN05660830_02613 [Halodesulfovibrio aestuarii]
MHADVELQGLCDLSETELSRLLAEDYGMEHARSADAETRMISYLQDLREVLRLESGAGVRVLRMWLDEACMNNRLARDEHMRERVALLEYARDRMADVALADPVCHVRLQLQFSQEWASAEIN